MTRRGFIWVHQLHKQYRDGEGNLLHILRGLDLEVQQGETVSIMGASGAGKSTLLHLIGALDSPDEGAIEVDGQDITRLSPEAGARFRNLTIGFVFQFHHLLMDFTALENVMMPMWIRAGRTLPFTDRARGLLAQVGLAERAQHRPAQLSGGEQQRLAIARAIANTPKVLLADEPTGNLDEETGAKVGDLLLQLNREAGLTLLLVTHNPQLAARMSRRTVLEHGQLRSVSGSATHG
ncbi:MAG TPA: ABC transporter ATP-binding protein [bacterium]|nr:ABC transporter ATP-binding protein [bacterium]